MDDTSLSNIAIPKPLSRSSSTDLSNLEERPSSHVDPPPPYPSRDRRTRAGTLRSLRRFALPNSESSGVIEIIPHGTNVNESSPLLPTIRRQRTISYSSVVTEESSQSLAQTVLSLFEADEESDTLSFETSIPRDDVNIPTKMKRYFRPLLRKSYHLSLFHLMMINFPYALLCFLFLFVGTLTGTTLLLALPLGTVIFWISLVAARVFARWELALQSRFHQPLAFQPPNPPVPIFVRPGISRDADVEASEQLRRNETSFLRNTYAMFTDPSSYQAIFYFLVIKPSITLTLTIVLIAVVPASFVLILPAPAVLRAVKRLGLWQANIAVEGLCRPPI